MQGQVSSRTALVVEDDAVTALALAGWLRGMGWSPVSATSADDALSMAVALRPEVAVCDVELHSEHDGVWLADRLLEDVPDTKVVFATANDCLPGSATLRSNVSGYLLKPFRRDQFEGVMARVPATQSRASSRDRRRTAGRVVDELTAARRSALVARVMDLVERGPFDDATLAAALMPDESMARAVRGVALVSKVATHLGFPQSFHRSLTQSVLFAGLGEQVFARSGQLNAAEADLLQAQQARVAPVVTQSVLGLLGMEEAGDLVWNAAVRAQGGAAALGGTPVGLLLIDASSALHAWRQMADPALGAPQRTGELPESLRRRWAQRVVPCLRQAIEPIWDQIVAGASRNAGARLVG